jgi:hypothetical protein
LYDECVWAALQLNSASLENAVMRAVVTGPPKFRLRKSQLERSTDPESTALCGRSVNRAFRESEWPCDKSIWTSEIVQDCFSPRTASGLGGSELENGIVRRAEQISL